MERTINIEFEVLEGAIKRLNAFHDMHYQTALQIPDASSGDVDVVDVIDINNAIRSISNAANLLGQIMKYAERTSTNPPDEMFTRWARTSFARGVRSVQQHEKRKVKP